MPRRVQHSFGSGEVSPKFTGRRDNQRYFNGVGTLENYVITHHGAIESRSGLRFVAEVKTSSLPTRLVKFQFSTIQSYVLEVGNFYIRFYKDGGRIEDPPGTPVEVATPYAAGDVFDLQFRSSADTTYIFHGGYQTHKLIRISHTSWRLIPVVFRPPPTQESKTFPSTTLTLAFTSGDGVSTTSAAGFFLVGDVGREIVSGGGRGFIKAFGSSTQVFLAITDQFSSTTLTSPNWYITGSPGTGLTPSAVGPVQAPITLTADADAFRSTDVGRYVHINEGIVLIESITPTVATGIILRGLSATTKAQGGTWTLEENAFSVNNGFPKTGAFFDGRLYVGGTATRPQTIWGSAVDDFENMGRGTSDDASLEFTLAGSLVDAIQWLVPIRNLFVGTLGGVLQVQGGTNTPITPTNVNVKSESAVGSSAKTPVRAGSAILYLFRIASKIYELGYNFDIDGYISQDMMLIADHLGEDHTFVDATYREFPWSVVETVRDDGVLCGLTYLRAQDLIGWSRIITQGLFYSATSIPHWTLPQDVTWVVVARTVQGALKRYVEYFDPSLETDSALTRTPTGVKVSSVSGLTHLAGLTVDVKGDGAQRPQQVVSAGGVVTLDAPADAVEIGLHFDSRLDTLPLALSEGGELAGMMKHWTSLYVRFHKTRAAVVNGQEVVFREIPGPMDSPPPEFTGNKFITNRGVSEEGTLSIQRTRPYRQTILYYGGSFDVSDL